MQLKTVVLPAPFGPISAVISPRRASKERSLMAIRPPNFIDRCSTLRRVSPVVLDVIMSVPKVINRDLPW
ncbi:Uncharacterised protein [Mycobacterium tuberculosis]|nr:Uncharacterised protein [Mycobacterium tuberculosis]